MLSVSDGSPRCATALLPGGEVTIRYELRARPGRHVFRPTTVLCRDASGSVEVERSLTAASSVECAAEVPTVPLRAQSGHHPGPLVTDDGGEGDRVPLRRGVPARGPREPDRLATIRADGRTHLVDVPHRAARRGSGVRGCTTRVVSSRGRDRTPRGRARCRRRRPNRRRAVRRESPGRPRRVRTARLRASDPERSRSRQPVPPSAGDGSGLRAGSAGNGTHDRS